MLLLAAAFFVVTPAVSAQVAPKAPIKAPAKARAKTPQQVAEEAATAQRAADEEAARKRAEEEAAAQQKAEADAAAAQKAAEEEVRRKAEEERQRAEGAALEARGLDARIRALASLVALPLKRLPGDHRSQRFAVLPFEEAGDATRERQLGLVVSDLLLTSLAQDHRLALVERASLTRILDEQALGQTGALADGQAAEVGKVSGARALIVGQVSDAGEVFRVSVRAVDAEAGTVIEGTARDVNLPKDELVAYSENAVVLRSRSGAMYRSVLLPGWGQSYNGEPVKAVVFGATVGTLAVATVTTGGIAGYARFVEYEKIGGRPEDKALVQSGEIGATVAAYRQASEAGLVAAGLLAGATAVAWGINVLDAYLSGTDVESLDAARARN